MLIEEKYIDKNSMMVCCDGVCKLVYQDGWLRFREIHCKYYHKHDADDVGIKRVFEIKSTLKTVGTVEIE